MKLAEKYFTKPGVHNVKFLLVSGGAAPGASIATLGQKKVNMKKFCDFFNTQSPEVIKNLVNVADVDLIDEALIAKLRMAVKMRIYEDETYELLIKNTSTATILKLLSKIEKGCSLPGKETVCIIERNIVEQVAKFKMREMRVKTLAAAVKTVMGTANSIGIKVI